MTEECADLKIFLVANSGWYLYNFRLPLISPLRERGADIIFVSPHDAYVDRIEKEGFRWLELSLDRKSVNPLKELYTIYHLIKIYLKEQPHIAHHFTIKCVLYGTIAAKISGIKKVVNSITGIGYLFISNNWTTRVLRFLISPLYRQVLNARRSWVIFQNNDDLELFLESNLVISAKTCIVKGSGVDTKKIIPSQGAANCSEIHTVLFAARLLVHKGIIDLIEAIRILKEKNISVKFIIAGKIDSGNPSSISEGMLKRWQQELPIEILGHVDNIETIIKKSEIVVLPSYREGVPKILLEAAAMGKPIVATDVPGCRDIVEHNKNGLLVPVNNPQQLASAICQLLENENLRNRMGKYSREKVVKEFDANHIAECTVDVYRNIGINFPVNKIKTV